MPHVAQIQIVMNTTMEPRLVWRSGPSAWPSQRSTPVVSEQCDQRGQAALTSMCSGGQDVLDGDDVGEAALQSAGRALHHLSSSQRSAPAPPGQWMGGRCIQHEADPVAEVTGHPCRGLTALLRADSADHHLIDSAAGEVLSEVGRGEGVVARLLYDDLTRARLQTWQQRHQASLRVEEAACARLGVQDPHDLVTANASVVDEVGDAVCDVRG